MSAPPRTATMETVRGYAAAAVAAVSPLPPRAMRLADADGAALAEDVTAAWPLPRYGDSAMDGYAVAALDLAEADATTPVTLPVQHEIAAGDTRQRPLAPGACARILTGALVPTGADAVVRRELVEETDGKATFTRPARAGESVRPAGGEARAGDLLLPAATPLGPARLGLLAAAGRASVLARPRPRVTILSAGDELVSPGTPTRPGQTWESNGLMLAAAARRLGCTVRRGPVVRDEPSAVRASLRDAAHGTDLIVTSGGISMGGEHDVFKAALSGLETVRFRRVAMRPGSPQGYGAIGDPPVPILLLPGNPVSAFVSFTLFGQPVIRALRGLPVPPAPPRAVLTERLESRAGETSFLGGVRDHAAGTVTPVGRSIHSLAGLARADCLIVVPADSPGPGQGESVQVLDAGW